VFYVDPKLAADTTMMGQHITLYYTFYRYGSEPLAAW